MQKPSVFVTGATGLVGSHIVRLLFLRGYERITALRRPGADLVLLGEDAARVRWIEGDILDIEALEEGMLETDHVIHAAGLISYQSRDRERLHEVNVQGTANVVNAALHRRVQKLMHVSSVSVLARTSRRQVCDESTPWKITPFTSLYGQTKHLAEAEVHRGIAEGLNASMIIPSIILGAGNWTTGSAAIFHRINKGMPAYPQGQNGFVDVRDVALLSVLLMELQSSQRVIANSQMVSYRTLFTEIARRIDKRPPSIPVGPRVSELLWRLFVPVQWLTGRETIMNRDMVRASQCFTEYDNSASLRIPGFGYTPLAKTLDDIAEKYRDAREKKFAPRTLDFSPEYLR